MEFLTFLETHQAQWPLGKIETLHQTHQLALGSVLTHPLQDSEFLRTAGFIQLTICRPKSHLLPLAEIREFSKKIAALGPEDGQFSLDVEDSEALEDSITVRILAVQSN